jgi:hypothetical protein
MMLLVALSLVKKIEWIKKLEFCISVYYLHIRIWALVKHFRLMEIESLMVQHVVEQAKKMKTSIISCESESIQEAQDAFEEHGFVETQDGQMSLVLH